jgi:UDP-N-acetylglucosamine--N-acetylmuramyl-(pentapeptide) pyrophosphoryl-undecaprenol N-acetylglucosamine transferase
MRILLTGGGTGGHIFPLIAVAQSIRQLAAQAKIKKVEFIFMGPKIKNHYWKWLVEKEGIEAISVPAGKIRRYASILNVIDFIKIPFSLLISIWKVFWHMPDVVFSKGGYGSFAVVLACRFYRVPVFIHESDARAGLANKKLAKHAKKVFVGFSSATEDFPKNEVIVSGIPLRREITQGKVEKARAFFHVLRKNKPVIMIFGGSQGAATINDLILNNLEILLPGFEIIHITGAQNYDRIVAEVQLRLGKLDTAGYHPYPFLSDEMALAYGLADIIIARSSGSTIFEIAANRKPSILIPLEGAAQDHQRANAYEYAKTGATIVLEEFNLTPHILIGNLEKILQPNIRQRMTQAAGDFIKIEAASLIAQELIESVYPRK